MQKGMINEYEISPEDSYIFALNMMDNKEFGTLNELHDETGNELCIDLEGHKIIGSVQEPSGRVFLFLQAINPQYSFRIWEVFKCTLVKRHLELTNITISNDEDWVYTDLYPIKAEFRTLGNCERILYWYNGFNSDKFIRLDKEDYHKDNLGNYILSSFLLKPEYVNPKIEYVRTNDIGGKLKTGKYFLATRYVDELGNTTDWSDLTQGVIVTDKGGNLSQQQGAIDKETTKSIDFQITNISNIYQYLEIASIQYSTGNQIEQCYIVDKIPINKNISTIDYTFTGVLASSKVTTFSEITTSTAKYENSKVMLQHDNRLLRGNLKEKKRDWSAYQAAMKEVEVQFITKAIKHSSENWLLDYEGSSKTASYEYNNKSLMRDEVYLFGIVYHYIDGSQSPVFYLNGREKNKRSDGTPISVAAVQSYVPNMIHNRPPAITNWDSDLTSVLGVQTNPDNEINNFDDVERWKTYNTAFVTNAILDTNPIWAGYPTKDTVYIGEFSYFENTQPYPDYETCGNNPERIFPTGNMRLFKTPDSTLVPHFFNDHTTDQMYINVLGVRVTNVPNPFTVFLEDDCIGYSIVVADRYGNKTVIDKGLITSNVAAAYREIHDTDDEEQPQYLFHQSMRMSWNNVFPYSMSCISQIAGDDRFLPIPSGSNYFNYNNNNGTEVATAASGVYAIFNDYSKAQAKDLLSFHSPMSKVSKDSYSGSHIKYEQELICGHQDSNSIEVLRNRRKYLNDKIKPLLTTSCTYPLIDYYKPYTDLTNRSLKNSWYIATNNDIININNDQYKGIYLNSSQQEQMLLQINGQTGTLSYDTDYINWSVDPGTSVLGIDNITESITTSALNWSTGVSPMQDYAMSYNYVSIKSQNFNIYKNPETLNFYRLDNKIHNFGGITPSRDSFGGDVYINRFAFRRTFYGYLPRSEKWDFGGGVSGAYARNKKAEDSASQDFHDVGTGTYRYNSFWESQLLYYFTESEINIELREEGDLYFTDNEVYSEDTSSVDPESFYGYSGKIFIESFFPKSYSNNQLMFHQLELLANSISGLKKEDGSWEKFNVFPNYYKLNPDYNVLYPKRFFGYKYIDCNDCSNIYSNRIVWSEKSYEEDISDNYRRFLVNNYIDITLNTSDITDLFEKNQELYVNTKYSLFRLPKTTEQMQTVDGSNITIGTGEFLSIPPYRLSNSLYNVAGNQGRFNRINTEYGVFYINQEQGLIYNFNEGLQPINLQIMQWSKKNLPYAINEYWKKNFSKEYPLMDNTVNEMSVGLQTTIDYTNDRLIIHKRDFLPVKGKRIVLTQTDDINDIYFDENTNTFYAYTPAGGGTYFEIFSRAGEVWEEKSFTLSYDMKEQKWLSFHSYNPDWMYNDGTTYYSTPYHVSNNYDLYTHNSLTQRKYYGQVYPSMIEWQLSKNKEIVDSLSYYIRTQEYDSINENWYDSEHNFTKGFLYNTYQTTYGFQIVNNDYYLWDDLTKNVITRERIHSINGFRQLNQNTKVLTSDWNVLQQYYPNYPQGYMGYDVIPVPGGYTSDYSLQNPIRDIFSNVRLIFQPTGLNPENIRLRFQMNFPTTTESKR